MANVLSEVNECIVRIDKIVSELIEITNELPVAIEGVSVSHIQGNLRDCVARYQRARNSLSSIHRV